MTAALALAAYAAAGALTVLCLLVVADRHASNPAIRNATTIALADPRAFRRRLLLVAVVWPLVVLFVVSVALVLWSQARKAARS